MKKLLLLTLFCVSCLGLCLSNAFAIPELQLYIEGATYDSETWVTPNNPFKLWVIGNVSGPGSRGSISNAFLAVAYPGSESGAITITPITTAVVADPSIPSAPQFDKTVTNGSVPVLSDGKELPSHGIYGTGTSWTQYRIGNFTLNDSPVGDLTNTFPPTWYAGTGQINAYDVVVTGYSWVHFDAFNTVAAGNKAKFAPFSHDAEATQVPEPGILILLGIAMSAVGIAYPFVRKI